MASAEEQAGKTAPLLPILVIGLAAAVFSFKQRTAQIAAASGDTHVLPAPLKEKGFASAFQRLKAIILTVYNGINDHRVLAIAAGVAFYSLLAIFPAIAAIVSLYGLFANPSSIASELQQLTGVLPEGAIEVIKDQLTRLSLQQQGTLGLTFIISIVVSLWSANAGVKALIDALNVVRGQSEKRSFIVLNAISLTFTTAAILFIIVALAAIVVLPVALHVWGLDQTTPFLVSVLRWPALFIPTTFGLALIYRYGPCCARPRWSWLSFGSLIAALLWLAASYLFSWYTTQFGDYNKTYGSLGAVVGFMTWIWISVIVILLGAELDMAIATTSKRALQPPNRMNGPRAV
jgi:membrane protein